MKLFLLVLTFSLPLITSVLYAQSHPIPPGVRQADAAETQMEKNIPPPLARTTTIDPQKLRHDADELSALAQSIPADVDQTANGVLPKDLVPKLKRIEKLAKHLRATLNP